MKIGESFLVAVRALGANRMRSILTMLGVIIGVAAVITLVSVGQGAERSVSQTIESLGTNLIMVTPGRGTTLELADVDYLKEKVPGVSAAMPIIQVSAEVSWRSNAETVNVQGVTPDFPAIRSFYPDTGRFIIQTDVDMRRKVAVVGKTVVENIFEGVDPIGQVISIKGQAFTVVGVMEEKGESFGIDNDNVVLVPVSTLQRLAGTKRISAIYAQAGDPDKTDQVMSAITSAFDMKFRRADSVQVASQQQLLETVSSITGTFTVLLASIAGVSLVVGGIGIMNIMLVSVTERTKEIGLRKALGARKSDILTQFLIESALLSCSGGLVGIGLGAVAARIVSQVGGWPSYVSPASVALAFFFSLGVGLFFGLYPASRAAKLDPIYCLRYE